MAQQVTMENDMQTFTLARLNEMESATLPKERDLGERDLEIRMDSTYDGGQSARLSQLFVLAAKTSTFPL